MTATGEIPHLRWLRLALVIVLCALMAACGSKEEAAFRAFSKENSCPRDRMTVTPIKDVTMRDLWLHANPEPTPAADVQADPTRLAVWRKSQEKNREGPLRGVKRFALFHVEGCGHEIDYACYCPSNAKGATKGSGSRQDLCGCLPPPAPIEAVRAQMRAEK